MTEATKSLIFFASIFLIGSNAGKINQEVTPPIGETYILENSTHRIMYYYEPRFTRYDENERICSSKGMTLAYVRNANENDFIKNFRKDHIRLGAIKDPFSRKYEWADGSEITFSNWSRDNYFYQGCCSVEMDEAGKWRKYRGDSSHLLCQKIIDKNDPKFNQTIEDEIKNPTIEEETSEKGSENSQENSGKNSEYPGENNLRNGTKSSKDREVSEREVANAIEFVQRSLSEAIQEVLINTTINITKVSQEIDQKMNESISNGLQKMKNEMNSKISNELQKMKNEMNSTIYQLSETVRKDLDQKMETFQNESAHKWSEMTSKNAVIVSREIESKVNQKLDSTMKEVEEKNDRLLIQFKDEMTSVKNSLKNVTQRINKLSAPTASKAPTSMAPTTTPPSAGNRIEHQESKNVKSVTNVTIGHEMSEKLSENSITFQSDQVKTISPDSATKNSSKRGGKSVYFFLISFIVMAVALIVYKQFLRKKLFKKLEETDDSMILE